MKATDYQYEPHIKVDAHGNIDTRYYINRAHFARAEYISELSQARHLTQLDIGFTVCMTA